MFSYVEGLTGSVYACFVKVCIVELLRSNLCPELQSKATSFGPASIFTIIVKMMCAPFDMSLVFLGVMSLSLGPSV